MGPPIDPKDLQPLFYWAGLTLNACQQFEYGVKALMVAMAQMGVVGFSVDEAVAIIEGERKTTLGNALRMLKGRVHISSGWVDSMDAGLEARNRFIHGFIPNAADRIADPATRGSVVSEIKEIRRVVLDADCAVSEMMETVLLDRGLDWKQLTKQWSDEVQAMNRPASDGSEDAR